MPSKVLFACLLKYCKNDLKNHIPKLVIIKHFITRLAKYMTKNYNID